MKRWLKRAYHHHAQSRELKRFRILVETGPGSRFGKSNRNLNVKTAPRPSSRSSSPARSASCPSRAWLVSRQRKSSSAMLSAASTARRSRIAGRRRFGGRAHLLVDVGRQPRDVGRIERGADRVALAADFDGDDDTVIGHQSAVSVALQIQRLQLFEHVADARANGVALFA